MNRERNPAVGLVFGGLTEPREVMRLASLGDELGFDEVWLGEDYFYNGGIALAASILERTNRISVGLGIVSALARHPALLAMELATLANLHPGRLLPGIGVGLPDWLRQMGLHPTSMVGALRECVTAVRLALAGESVTSAGSYFYLDRISLAYPPKEPLPIFLGVAGPRLLELSGEIGDGTVLGLNSPIEYIRWAQDSIAIGAKRAGRTGSHRITCFATFSLAPNAREARGSARGVISEYLALSGRNAMTDAYGISDELSDMIARGGPDTVEQEMPDQWVDDLAIVGDPDLCETRLRALAKAGVSSVALYPQPADKAEQMLRLAAQALLPRMRDAY
jgi:alkanesulfonate monooxygenase SsuD/methylene tetrahydromethanopterin reductase-like flavin-dependent oxidoreductase (luciferase family)